MKFPLIQCPAWSAGTCSDPIAVARFGARPSAGICVRACGRGVATGETIEVADAAFAPIPRDRWPTWAATVAAMRQDGERGVGSTFERLAATAGLGAAYKAILAAVGKTCGCADRKRRWDAEYPYHP